MARMTSVERGVALLDAMFVGVGVAAVPVVPAAAVVVVGAERRGGNKGAVRSA